MAEEEHGSGGVPETVTFIVLLLIVLAALSWIRNGPPKALPGNMFFQAAPSIPSVAMPAPNSYGSSGPTPQSGLRY